uniref:Uncharacterized protein n=1 Tax=Anopheles minimus TaxID=112268 RepID=A0A182WQD2_9DIPT
MNCRYGYGGCWSGARVRYGRRSLILCRQGSTIRCRTFRSGTYRRRLCGSIRRS